MGWFDFSPWQAPEFPQGAAFGTGSPAEEAQRQPTITDKLVSGLINSMATLPQRAIQNSQFALGTGTYDPGPTLEAAMLPMGTGAVAGVPVRAGEAVLGAGPIRAYHGSPYDFERFDLSKIGTGEGAQAYGHGLYFAENPETAKAYQATLGRDAGAFNLNGKIVEGPSPEYAAASLVHKFGEAPSAIAARLPDEPAFSDVKKILTGWGNQAPPIVPGRGKMYEVNINADPAHFLDWDKPLAKQTDQIQDALFMRLLDKMPRKKAVDEMDVLQNKTGDSLYRGLSLNPREATQALASEGIPGIKYLDQGSRSSGQGSSNYVVFNDKLIDILRKYGLAGIAPPAALFANSSEPQT